MDQSPCWGAYCFEASSSAGQNWHWLPTHVCLPEKNRPSRPGNRESAHAATSNQGQVASWVSCNNHQLAKTRESLYCNRFWIHGYASSYIFEAFHAFILGTSGTWGTWGWFIDSHFDIDIPVVHVSRSHVPQVNACCPGYCRTDMHLGAESCAKPVSLR